MSTRREFLLKTGAASLVLAAPVRTSFASNATATRRIPGIVQTVNGPLDASKLGRSFLVSLRKTFEHEPDQAGFLHEALALSFEEIVRRATKAGLKRHIEAKGGRVPSSLSPEEVFF